MYNVGLALFILSLIGFLGMTVGPALVSSIFYSLKKLFNRYPLNIEMNDKVLDVEFLIPVHNQARDLEETLKSLKLSDLPYSVCVGANACTDHTEEVAIIFGAKILKRPIPGKWGMLCELIEQSTAEWIVLIDAGTLLPDHFFEKIKLKNLKQNIIGVAPRYYPHQLGRIQKGIWIFEGLLKKLENLAGGPVSVHGACVLYRREKLQKVISSLRKWNEHEVHWQNDDVVIPLWMRFQNPQGKIIYRFDVCIDDWDIHLAPPSPARRKRLIKGNIQWITMLWPRLLKGDLSLFLLSSRRLFRVMWAWWPSFFYLGCLLMAGSVAFKIAIVFQIFSSIIFLAVMMKKSELASAFVSSLLFFRWKDQLQWK